MTTLEVMVAVLAVAALLHRTRKRRPAAARTRSRALFAVVALLGMQVVLGAPPALAAECGEAPNPERPGSGMVGALDPAQGQGEKGSAYVDYGYAGMVWHTYTPESECGALSGITDPNSTIDTWAGNQLFNVGKNIVGATNSLHYTVMEGGLLSPLYDAVRTGAEKVYNNIYAQLFGIAAVLLALLMFRNIWRGDLSAVSKRALFALGAVWLAASSFALLRYYDDIDRAIVQTTTNIQAGFVDESQNRVVRHVLPTTLHNEVVYNNWLRGEFGSAEAPQAEQFGRPLLDAQAFTWAQIRDGADADQTVVDAKKSAYTDISKQLGPATGYFTGEDGSRTGAGLLSLGQSLVYSLFQLFAKAAVLLAQVLVRLFTLTAPLLGLVALVHHDILRKVAKLVGAVAFNLLVLSVLAGVHALLLQAIFAAGDSLSMLTQMVMAGLITVLLFLVGKPTRRLWQMVEMSVGAARSAVPSPRGGLFSRFRKRQEEPSQQDEFWRNIREGDDDGAAVRSGSGRSRPEAAVVAGAQRLDRHGGAARPAAAWSDQSWSGAAPELAGNGGRAALPAAGSAAAAAAFPYRPDGRPDRHGAQPSHPTQRVQQASRAVDTAPVADRRWDRGDDAEPVVVPSRMTSSGESGWQPPPARQAPPAQPAPAGGQAPQPRKADSEVVAGKPVFVLYRPSRGLEVREDLRDTDRVVR